MKCAKKTQKKVKKVDFLCIFAVFVTFAQLCERNVGGGASFRFRKERHPPRMVIILQGRCPKYYILIFQMSEILLLTLSLSITTNTQVTLQPTKGD